MISNENNISTQDITAIQPQIAVFSARNPSRLQAVVRQMLEFIEAQNELSLSNLVYTLQVGREAMEFRLAMVVSNQEELIHGMKQYLKSLQENKEFEFSIPIYTGDMQGEHAEIRSLLSGKAGDTLLQMFLAERNLDKLALYWAKGGKIPWKLLHEEQNVKLIPLPTYPFAKKRYWISEVDEQHPIEIKTSINQVNDQLNTDSITNRLKKRISELLGIPIEELPTGKSLNSLGFNSLQAVNLRYWLEQDLCTEIPITVVNEHKSIENIDSNLHEVVKLKYTEHQPKVNLLVNEDNENLKSQILSDTSEILPKIVSNIVERYQPFALNDIQESFLTGRKLRFGGDWVGCHIYFEIEVNDLDIYRLNDAWERLIDYHEMLRSVILSDGQQKILQKAPPYKFKIVDIRRKNSYEGSEHLKNVRKDMSHKLYEPNKWPFFEIRISVCPDSKYVIHFSIDEFIVDASGINMLLQQWQQLYEKPDWKLPELNVSFRDYILAVKKFEDSKRYKKDLTYWIDKLEKMPQGPVLSLRQKTNKTVSKATYYRTRLNGTLEKKNWDSLKEKAKKLGVSTTALLLSIFTEVLRFWSSHETFSLILTYFNRLPLHPQLNQVLGPFISTNIFVVEAKSGRSFEDLIKYNQELLWNDMDHISASGIRVLRELKARRKISNFMYLPVVFTSLLNNFKVESTADKENFFNQISFMVTQTPQVYLDHQVFEQNGKLKFSWDVAEEYFQSSVIRDMFDDYCRVLHMLSLEKNQWELEILYSEIKGKKFLNSHLGVEEKDNIHDIATISQSVEVLQTGLQLEVLSNDSFKPFPLTDLQQAYAFGRYLPGAKNSCQVYLEIEAEELDIKRLEKAWQKLIKVHEMLITVIHPNGSQSILDEVPDFNIKVTNLTGKNEEEIKTELSTTKRFMLEHVFNLDEWPYFDLRILVLDSVKSRIHFSVDMLIADVNSIQLLLKQLFYFYENSAEEPKKVDISFRDYVLSLQNYKKTEDHQRSIEYWEHKFKEIPPGPQLPMKNSNKNSTFAGHQQLRSILLKWDTLKKKANKLSVSPSMVLLTAYAEVLAAWSGYNPFSIVIPCWDRIPFHPEIDEVVGDFTAMSWVMFKRKKEPFEVKVQLNHMAVQEDLSHMAVSGLKVLRKVVMRGDNKGMLIFPIVFTNMTTHSSVEAPKGFKILEMSSKAPQVFLDNISEERDGKLYFHWDVLKGVYPEGMIEEMFSGYERVLEALIADSENWEKIDFNTLINAQPEKYKNYSVGREF
ncbi:Phenyloxazoline synthase MbtB [Clostridium formicaceticum]|uniref:Phenyloxazoline synthase MbtB n=2 Tax=Clostridium formicaceticum TaxID=1497 RepID=A0AAC9WFF1_9CLOT|nr:hypothetical protein BJL90_10290 [Clostridium formicaceticum]ARE86639.1 Phenyloxazoline synthase MbtB [Clostridium formicaceticum]